MIVFYNLLLLCMRATYRVAALVHNKANAFVTGRKDVFSILQSRYGSNTAPVVWVHCASLGEFEQGRPIIEALKKEYPRVNILLTFFSPSGYEVRKHYELADHVCYLPWDSAAHARQFVDIVKPVMAIFVKYEFWHHYARTLKNRNIPLLSVSSIFREDQLFFKPYGGFYKNILKNFSWFFVQNDASLRLLKSIGINTCSVVGDTRFDRVFDIVKQGDDIAVARQFKNDQKTVVVGSCWPEDFDVLAPLINENNVKFIIAPHEITEPFIATMEGALQVKSVRYSQAQGKTLEDYQVLIIDNIGMLSRLYRYGEFAFVGGAFGKGLHNILEAACYGVPIFFGNKDYEKYQEAVDLINLGGAFEVRDYTDLKAKYELLNSPESFLLACAVTKLYVEENLGATEKIMKYCRTLLA
ncbi:3-deoxy-D-manno-octulosonic acid transferase [Chryseolinea lacunae]|uniref:3-deoxy-D-manno-octulosonic acid transferase n=1 Tax=Chryseolinea lacunae TaxID=2801331 RepID=A0ABS1KLG4_9BACT|nr:glycosyltransferase N-terminal domain-containing protein [Chryseolinea lacunae]MBL0740313.1 3-deoxy-D-manno-octulosonic acid transferase [Chryseolinea lacunae]